MHKLRWILVNGSALALLNIFYYKGWLQLLWGADTYHLSKGIVLVFLFGWVCCSYSILTNKTKFSDLTRRVANSLITLGLIGTVIGFIIALSGINPNTASNASSIQTMISAMILGMGIALHTTLLGAILNLYLMINLWILNHAHQSPP